MTPHNGVICLQIREIDARSDPARIRHRRILLPPHRRATQSQIQLAGVNPQFTGMRISVVRTLSRGLGGKAQLLEEPRDLV
jgi:hypothetical protein